MSVELLVVFSYCLQSVVIYPLFILDTGYLSFPFCFFWLEIYQFLKIN